jgi:hypothetical protein
VNVPAPIVALMEDLEEVCVDDPSLAWSEAEVSRYLNESALDVDGDDEEALVGWLRRSVAYYLWWSRRGIA